MKNKNLNSKENQKTFGGFTSSAATRRASILRPVLVCLLFLAIVVSSVFGISGLFGGRKGNFIDNDANAAYADAMSDAWKNAVDNGIPGSPQTFKLNSDWVATVKDKDNATVAMRRTEFGNDSTAFVVSTNNSTYNYTGALFVPTGHSVILDLNGHKIDRNLTTSSGLNAGMGESGYCILVEGELKITDSSSGKNGRITGGWNNDGRGGSWSSAILVRGNGKLTMDAGNITGNKGNRGGAVALWGSNTQFLMSGTAKVTNNESTSFADYNSVGGVSNYDGRFEMSGTAEISGNTGYVGGLSHYYPNPWTKLSDNAVIKNNISAANQDQVDMIKAGEINVNTATGYGYAGGIYLHYGLFEMYNNATVSGNQGVVGGISDSYNCVVNLYNNASVKDNFSNTNTACSYSTGGIFNYYGTVSLYNKAVVSGNKGVTGGIRATDTTSYVNLYDDSSVKNNISDREYDLSAAAGIYGCSATVITLRDSSTVTGNHALHSDLAIKADGQTERRYGVGGITYYGSLLIEDNATVSNNVGFGTLRGVGGCASWDGRGTLTMHGGTITGNIGNISGGVFKYPGSTMNIGYNPKVYDNYVQDDEDGTNKTANDVDLHCGRIYGASSYYRPPVNFRTNVMTVDQGLEQSSNGKSGKDGNGAYIGVVKYTNNYVTDANAAITSQYYLNNSTEKPDSFFFHSLGEDLFTVRTMIPPTGYAEAGFTSKVEVQNWQDAVAASSTTLPQTITLTHDLVAKEFNGSMNFYAMYNNDDTGFVYGALHVPAGKYVILDLNGHKVDRKLTTAIANGYVINNAGTLEITDTSSKGNGVITGGKTASFSGTTETDTGYGGGIYNTTTLTITGGSIEGNTAHRGAGVYMASGILYLKGGQIKSNTAVNVENYETTTGMGGGIYATNPATVNITGGTISHNNATYGGGIYMFTASNRTDWAAQQKLIIKGGTIKNNHADLNGGGIGFSTINTPFEMSGAPVIEDNTFTDDDEPNDIHLPSVVIGGEKNVDNGMIKITAALTGSKKYGVYRDIGYTFTIGFGTYNVGKQASSYFTAQKPGYSVYTTNKEGELISDHGKDNWYSAVVLSRIHNAKSYTVTLTEDWTAERNTNNNFNTSFYGPRAVDSNTAASGAYYYGALNVPSETNITLDLNGYTLDRALTSGIAGSGYGMVISVYGGRLTIKDSSEEKDSDGVVVKKGTGTITGGWIHSSENYRYGGGITLMDDGSRLNMLGGIITHNKSTGFYSTTTATGVGGVGLRTASSQFTMTGGYITENIGTFGGGVGVHTLKTNTISLGGSAVIEGNTIGNFATKFGEGTPSDVHNPGYSDAGGAGTTLGDSTNKDAYKLTIVTKFVDGARIGISRPGVNNVTFMQTNGNVFTNNYSTFNKDENNDVIDPSKYFFASNKSQGLISVYEIKNGSNVSGYEATLRNVDPASNWSNAHAAARNVTTDSPIEVKLECDWIADASGSLGSGSGFSANGGLAMSQSNIILDLNGYTIDRGLTDNAIENGYVLQMSGTCRLEIRDSSEAKTGRIIGGNNLTVNQAGGINVTSATAQLVLNGGTIEGNKGDAGGVATYYESSYMTSSYFAMGGSIVVQNNLDISDQPLNVNLRAKYVQQIVILSELTADELIGITKDSSSDFTVNYSSFNSGSPVDHFVADSLTNYVTKTNEGEGALYTMDNYSNWLFAVNESSATAKERTVMLVSDWTADDQGNFGKSTADNFAFFQGGGLNVPASAKIILDLNGYTINRDLFIPVDYGFVINVEGGKLTIIDSYSGSQRVGTITGGKNRTASYEYNGGGINNRGQLYIKGGVITGNYSTGDVSYSTGGVYNRSANGVYMYMTGGKIINNVGAYAGGAFNHMNGQIKLGGSAVIKDNETTGAILCDVRPAGDSISNKIDIYEKFTEDADIGVSYIGNNYGTRESRIFTTNFSSLNPVLKPNDVFHYADPLVYKVVSLAANANSTAYEAAVECVDNEQNWRQAIEASSATVKQTVTLTRDWVAGFDASLTTSFGSNTNAYKQGALLVPNNRYVVLDLNGYKLDRGLVAQKTQGHVILVEGGNLEITDSRSGGIITGGFSTDTAGGIQYTSGYLTLTGGKITGNVGTAGGVNIARADTLAADFNFGGSANVSGNSNIMMEQSDILANSPIQMINVISPITAKDKTGFNRPGVGEFTTNFQNQMKGKDPTNFFTSADPMYIYRAESGEGAIYTNDNATNWLYAVKASIAGNKKQITFMLVDDWTAEDGVFGTDATAYVTGLASGSGALYVPNNADIVLDLNGYTLDRHLTFAVSEGYICRIYGNLKVIDTRKGGVITGGFNSYNSSTYAAQSSVFYIYSGGRLVMEGGTLTGNRATGDYSSAITLQYGANVSTATITGGTITGNYGGSTTINSTEGAGGVLIMSPNTLRLGGSPKIENNFHNNGYVCDVRLQAPGYYIEIVDQFTSAANIGVAPTSQVDNWVSDTSVGWQFTNNYSSHHSASNGPSRYFFGAWQQKHKVIDTFKTVNGTEGALYCMENYTNWINACRHSSTTKGITFQLTENWIAEPHNTFDTSFHPTDTTYYTNGAIYLPPNNFVILDLNGYKIDRNLMSSRANGYAMFIRGHLEIIDTSAKKTGMITGAYNSQGGGGIVSSGEYGNDNGLIHMEAGTIAGNIGTEGAGVYIMNNGTSRLELGGYAQIYGNYNTSGENSDVYLQNQTSTIKIISALTGSNRELIGIDRPSNGDVTVGFQDQMYGFSPLDYFESQNPNYYGIESGEGEFFFLSPNNDINWEYAVTQSQKNSGRTQTVRLASDWVAGDNDSTKTAFYTAAPTSNGIWNGALYVPTGVSIELDLAGYKIDRNLKSTQANGLVFLVLGRLTIIDSSDDGSGNGTGVITGGHNSGLYNYAYAGAIHVGWSNTNSTLELNGGTISGNQIDVANGAGAVYVWPGSTLKISDAKITENKSPSAGVIIADGGLMSAGGRAIIEGNETGSGLGRDVIFHNYTGVINVTSSFSDGAHIGIYRAVNNYDARSMGGSKITADYGRYNTAPVETYFFASDAPFHDIIEVQGVGVKEVALFCYNNETNWYNAITYSNNIRGEAEVKLYSDWTATTRPSEVITYFNLPTYNGGNSNAYYQGALHVNSTAQIKLDLNGYVIDRALKTPYRDYGYAIYVLGSLHIVDTSLGGAGMITGGYLQGTSELDVGIAAGIHLGGGAKFTMEGGTVTGNKGIGVYAAGNNSVGLGGKANIKGNVFDSKTEVNLYLEQNSQMINVVSAFEDGAAFGVTRTKGANNYASGPLTVNYSKYNKSVLPSTIFVSDKSDYDIVDDGDFDDEDMEAVFLGKDNVVNWAYAVKTSLDNSGRAQTFKLSEDWVAADTNNNLGTSFGSESYGYLNGALMVPYGCSIILDLNGHTIDRNLMSARDWGEVFYVHGTLTIIDSSDAHTGTITGGYGRAGVGQFHLAQGGWNNYYADYAGGISVFQGTLNIEAGTIKGNRMSHTTVLAGGVYLSGGSTLNMSGGAIIENSGRAYGGVYADSNATVKISGTARIENNEQMTETGASTGYKSNLYFPSATNLVIIGGRIDENVARIGISVNSNQIDNAGRFVTSGWHSLNDAIDVTKVFFSDHEDQYKLENYNQDGTHEAILYCKDNQVNWSNAVATSLRTGTVQTFVLYEDWTAETYAFEWWRGVGTSFDAKNKYGTGYYYGALHVPFNAKIILDLNGHTIDRDLYKRDTYLDGIGYTILVYGELTIIDSTAKVDKNGNIQQGTIKGGYQYYGGAIYADYGKLDVQAGNIEGNKSGTYGAGIFIHRCEVSIGGTVQFKDNYVNGTNERADIYFYDNSSPLLSISKQFQTSQDPTYNDIYVRREKIGTFTKDWGKNNPNTKPETRFKAQNSSVYRTYSTGVGTSRECVLLANNNYDNWLFAVNASIESGVAEHFTLVQDWTASVYDAGSYTTSFGGDGRAYRNGALLVPSNASIVLDLDGHTLDRNHSANNDTLYSIYNMTIIVEGKLQIIDTSSKGEGTIKGGSYGVYLNNKNAVVTIGGIPIGNDVIVSDGGNEFGTVFGGNISNNSLAGVYVSTGTFTATDGKIAGNAYGVYVCESEDAVINVAANALIYDDKSNNIGVRLEGTTDVINIIDKLSPDARIGYNRQGVGQLTNGWGLNQGNSALPLNTIFFPQEGDKFTPTTEEFNGYTEITVSSFNNAVNWQATVDKSLAADDEANKQQEFNLFICWIAELTGSQDTSSNNYNTSFGTSSAFKNGALYVPEGADIVLNLNGHKLDRNLAKAVENGYVIIVDGKLTIKNEIVDDPANLTYTCCSKELGWITGGKNRTGSSTAGIYVGKTGNVVFESGRIHDTEVDPESATATSSSGAVYVAGTFTMNGGVIENCTGTSAGAIYVASSGTLVLNDGDINNNEGKHSGAIYSTGIVDFKKGDIHENTGSIGGIYVAAGGKLTMEQDAVIRENRGGSAGAIFVSNGLNTYFTMNGGAIHDNNAISAGAIYAGGKVEIKGGTITDNKERRDEITGEYSPNEGAGAIYVSGTGNVSITGGEITQNTGVSGIRVHTSGTLSVGGSAIIMNNIPVKESISGKETSELKHNGTADIYFVASTKKLVVNSAFTDVAQIGIYRLETGIFTSGYGMYNSKHPNTVFKSNVSAYEISLATQTNVLENEASIGVVVNPAPTGLDTPNVYDGTAQVIIKDIDLTKVSFDASKLPEGVTVSDADENGLVSLLAVNAGTYSVIFSLAGKYCWEDGTIANKSITGEISPKVVELVWADHEHTDGTKCVYNGTVHQPTAKVKASSLVGSDECDVKVKGGQQDAGTHTATAYELTNPNYAIDEDNNTTTFVIEKAARTTFTITTENVNFNTPTQVEVSGNKEDGELVFSLVNPAAKATITADGKLTITDTDENAKIEVRVSVGETKNYKDLVITKQIGWVPGELQTTIDLTEMEYDEIVTLALKDYDSSKMGAVTWVVQSYAEDTGRASISENKTIKATNVGKVKLTANVAATKYYTKTTITCDVTIKPKQVSLNWGDLKVVYDGNEQAVEVPTSDDFTGAACTINVYKAGSAGWETRKEAAAWTNAGKYDVGVVLSNANYCLSEDEQFVIFEIEKAEPVLEFVTKEVKYAISFIPEATLTFGDPNSEITITFNGCIGAAGGAGNYTRELVDGKVRYTALELGSWFNFEASVPETDNFKAGSITVTFKVEKASLPLEVEPLKVYYGKETTLTAFYTDADGIKQVLDFDGGEVTFAAGTDTDGVIKTLSGNKITVNKVGKFNIKVTSVAIGNYIPTTVEIELEAIPFELNVNWTIADKYVYDGTAQHPNATFSGVLAGESATISGYAAYTKNEEGDEPTYELVEGGAVHVGTYYIIPIFDNANYSISMDDAAVIVITPRVATLVWDNTTLNYTYDGEEHAPTATVSNLVGEDSCTVSVRGTDQASSSAITAVAYELDNEDYTLDGVDEDDLQCSFYIDPKEITVEWSNTELDYIPNTTQAPTATAVGLIGDDVCEIIVSGGQINAGDWVAKASGVSNSNYKLGTVDDCPYTIKKQGLDLTLNVEELVYGDKVVLQVNGNSGNGKVTYVLPDDCKIATLGTGNLLTATGVGELALTVKIGKTDNYEEKEFEVKIKISPRPIEVSWSDLEFEYDGDLHNAVATITNAINGDDVELVISAGKANAATYTAEVTGIGGDDGEKYTLTDGDGITQEFVIKPRVITVTWSDTEFTYDGEEHAPTATITNKLDKDTCTVTVKGATDAGNKIVAEITELSNSNYTFEGSDTAKTRFNIKPKLVQLEWSDLELEYNGKEQLPTVVVKGLVGEDECKVNLSGAAAEVGEHTATATGLDNSNYTLDYDEEKVAEEDRPVTQMTFTIKMAQLEIDLATKEITYGSDLTLSLVSNPENAEVTYVIKSGSENAKFDDEGKNPNILITLNAGKVTLTVTVADSDNYIGGTKDIEITIKQLAVEIEWTNGSFTYNAKEQAPKATIVNAVGDDVINITVKGETDAGENCKAEVTTLDNPNYTLTDGINVTTRFVIQPKAITTVTWDYDDDNPYPFTGEKQGPTATLGQLFEGDTCEPEIEGYKTEAGKWVAKITGVKNKNYTLDGLAATTLKCDYRIVAVEPTITLKTTQVIIGTWETLEIEGNIGNGEVSYELVAKDDEVNNSGKVDYSKYAEISGDQIFGKALGKAMVKVTVSATNNTSSVTIYGEVTISKGEAPLALEKTTVAYGYELKLIPSDNDGTLLTEDGESMLGTISYSLDARFSAFAELKSVTEDDGSITTILVAKQAKDEVILHMSMEANGYFEQTSITVKISITPRVVSIKWTGDKFEYNGEEQAPTAEVDNLVDGDEVGIAVSTGTDAGKYEGENASKAIELTGRSKGNYTLELATGTTHDFEITPAHLTVTWEDLTVAYNKEEQAPTVKLEGLFGEDKVYVHLTAVNTSDSTDTYTIVPNEDGEYVGGPVLVGTYLVTTGNLDGEAAGNYVLDASYEEHFTIEKADLKLTFTPAQVTYGEKTEIVLTGNLDEQDFTLEVLKQSSVGFGTITQEDGKYYFEATRSGNVKIKVHVDGSDNCNVFDGNVDLEVVKAERVTTLVSVTGTYGSDLTLKIDGNDGESGNVTFKLLDDYKDAATIVGNVLTPKRAGTIAISIRVSETENYKDEEVTIGYITIQRRIVEIEWENTEFTYDGNEHAPTAKIKNLLPGDECNVTVIGGQTAAGTYEDVEAVELSNENYTLAGSVTATTVYTIGKKKIEVTLKNNRVGAEAPTELIILGNEGNAAYSFTIEKGGDGKATIEGHYLVPSKKGTVYVTITVEESDNHLGVKSQPILVIIDKSPLNLTLKTNEVLYGEELKLEVEGNVEDKEVLYTVVNADGKAEIAGLDTLLAKQAGKVYVTAKIAESNLYAVTEETFEVNILPRTVRIRWSTKNEFLYNGTSLQAPTATIVSGLLDGDECEVIVEGGQIDVKEYAAGTAYAKELTNPNYKLDEADVSAPKFKIIRASVEIEFVTTAVTINVPTEIKIKGNVEFGQPTFTLDISKTETSPVGDGFINGKILTGTKLGFVHVMVSVPATANYNEGFAEIDIEIELPEAPVDFTNKEVEYGQQLQLVIDKGFREDGITSADEGGTYEIELVTDDEKATGSATLSGTTLTATGAGDVFVMIKVSATESYKQTNKKIKITITPIVIEVTWTYPDLIYNGQIQTPTATVTNAINGDTFNLEYSGSKNAGDDLEATIIATGNKNYTVVGANVTTTYTIKPRPVELSWTEAEFTYNGKEQAPEVEITNVVEGDSVSVTVEGETNANNSATAKAVELSNSNYTLEDATNVEYTYRIKPLEVTVKWGELHLTYNGKNQVPEATAEGTLNNEVVYIKVTGPGKSASKTAYTAMTSGVDGNPNYTLSTQAKTDYYIDPVRVTFKTETLKKEYNGEKQDPTLEIDKLAEGDRVNLGIAGGQQSEVGKYTVVLSLNGADSGNYYLDHDQLDDEKEFEITKKKVNIVVTTLDRNEQYTGSAIDFSGTDWYELSCNDFVGSDKGKTVKQIFPTITVKIVPMFKDLNNEGELLGSVGLRGEYSIIAQEPTEGEIADSMNYEAVIVINTEKVGKLTISGGDALKLAETSTFKYSSVEIDEASGDIYRKSYDELGLEHGKDDLNFERVVLGNVMPDTCVGDLLNGIDASQLDKVRIYDQYGDLIFDCGSAAEGVDESDLYDSTMYAVGTGWKITYGLDEDMADTVYISVLGDLDGNGFVTSEDISVISDYIKGEIDLEDAELMVSALVENFGFISAEDISILADVIKGKEDISNYFC